MLKYGLVFLCTFFLFTSTQAQILVDSIIERSLRALGGREHFDEIEILYREGTISIGVQSDITARDEGDKKIKVWWLPFKGIRTEIIDTAELIGSVFTPTYANRYHIIPRTQEVDQFENVPAYELRTMMNLYNKLSFIPELCLNTYNSSRNTKLQGFEYVDDVRCFKLTYRDNTIYVNEKTFLPLKLVQHFKDEKEDTQSFVEYYFSDYQKTSAGLVLPNTVEQTRKGNDIPLIYRYTKTVLNQDGPRDELLVLTEYKKKNDAYIIRMGNLYREQSRKRTSPSKAATITEAAILKDQELEIEADAAKGKKKAGVRGKKKP